jgi:DNA-directed RNA polymerase subunit M/transcription elongation factor TFIIS
MDEYPRKAMFVECRKCGERWKVATIPMECSAFSRAIKRRGDCPNCGEKKEVFCCKTDGPEAVYESRNGTL